MNHLPTLAAVGAVVGLGTVVLIVTYYFSPRFTDVGYQPDQPVDYSHKLHAGLLGMDCRYCHQSVEEGPHANIPDTGTCLNCHTQVKQTSEKLAKVRESGATGEPIEWLKVHLLPDYVYFDHAVHVNAGVGCVSCHGRIDQMEIVAQAEPLNMGWCLECHRAPENHLRPVSEVTNMDYVHDRELAKQLLQQKNINPPEHCGACHR
jgi:hypothetical protein